MSWGWLIPPSGWERVGRELGPHDVALRDVFFLNNTGKWVCVGQFEASDEGAKAALVEWREAREKGRPFVVSVGNVSVDLSAFPGLQFGGPK